MKRAFGVGSKSERPAVLLVTNDREYVLRRPGANAFSDPELDKFVGKRVLCKGNVHGGYTFLVSEMNEVSVS